MFVCKRSLDSRLIQLGQFQLPVSHPRFRDRWESNGHLLVFPKEPVLIRQDEQLQFVANPNIVVFYNKHLSYWRQKISEWGDRCDFLDVSSEVLVDSISRYDPGVSDRPESPFMLSSVAVDNQKLLAQRRLFAEYVDESNADRLAVEERAIGIVDSVIDSVFEFATKPKVQREADNSWSKQRAITENCKLYLSEHFLECVSIAEVADAIDKSASHMCRVFKSMTGKTVHDYLTDLRLRTALERVRFSDSLTHVAFDLGFSSHSHFSSAFRRAFGISPSAWRNNNQENCVRWKRLTCHRQGC